jgi:hypothetical protein
VHCGADERSRESATLLALTPTGVQHAMSNPSTKPTYVSLHRLGELSGKARGTLLLRMRDGELVPDALLDLGGRLHPLFVSQRVAELKRLPSRKSAPVINPML